MSITVAHRPHIQLSWLSDRCRGDRRAAALSWSWRPRRTHDEHDDSRPGAPEPSRAGPRPRLAAYQLPAIGAPLRHDGARQAPPGIGGRRTHHGGEQDGGS